MTKYIVRRILLLVPILVGILFVTFLIEAFISPLRPSRIWPVHKSSFMLRLPDTDLNPMELPNVLCARSNNGQLLNPGRMTRNC